MIVRILNRKTETDKFFDCRNSCLCKCQTNKPEEWSLILEFTGDHSIEQVLGKGDEIYYMNDNGKTVHADYRMLQK